VIVSTVYPAMVHCAIGQSRMRYYITEREYLSLTTCAESRSAALLENIQECYTFAKYASEEDVPSWVVQLVQVAYIANEWP
jgi:hypothetical protein